MRLHDCPGALTLCVGHRTCPRAASYSRELHVSVCCSFLELVVEVKASAYLQGLVEEVSTSRQEQAAPERIFLLMQFLFFNLLVNVFLKISC